MGNKHSSPKRHLSPHAEAPPKQPPRATILHEEGISCVVFGTGENSVVFTGGNDSVILLFQISRQNIACFDVANKKSLFIASGHKSGVTQVGDIA
jgi:hypothetical protein